MAEADSEGEVGLCSECFAEIGGGSCGDHPDDPPIDPTRPAVRDLLADKDAEGLLRLQRKLMAIGAIPGILAFLGLAAFRALHPALPRFIVTMVPAFVTFAGLTVGRQLANRRFKPRFARWTGRDYHMDEESRGL